MHIRNIPNLSSGVGLTSRQAYTFITRKEQPSCAFNFTLLERHVRTILGKGELQLSDIFPNGFSGDDAIRKSGFKAIYTSSKLDVGIGDIFQHTNDTLQIDAKEFTLFDASMFPYLQVVQYGEPNGDALDYFRPEYKIRVNGLASPAGKARPWNASAVTLETIRLINDRGENMYHYGYSKDGLIREGDNTIDICTLEDGGQAVDFSHLTEENIAECLGIDMQPATN